MNCALAYLLIALLHDHSHAFIVLPGNDASYSIVDASHVTSFSYRWQCPSCLIAVARVSAKNKAFQLQNISGVSSRVRESMIEVEQLIELSSISAICHSHAVDLQLLQSFTTYLH